jgi:hypothetical protein
VGWGGVGKDQTRFKLLSKVNFVTRYSYKQENDCLWYIHI